MQEIGNTLKTENLRQDAGMNAGNTTHQGFRNNVARRGLTGRRIRIAAIAFCVVVWGVVIYFALT